MVWQLDRHQRLHLSKQKSNKNVPQRPFQCNVCGKRTSTEKAMNTHYRRFHSPEMDPRTATCDLCNKVVLKINMSQHRLVHSDVRNYKCQYCASSYKQKQSLTLHIRKQHPEHRGINTTGSAENNETTAEINIQRPELTEHEKNYLLTLFFNKQA